MDIDNFEWWYSEGEAPDEEWDEPAPCDVSSDEDETGNDAGVEPEAASDAAEPLTFEQAWAQAEADEAKADATATLGEPADMSISPAKTPQPRHTIDPGSTASFSILDVPAQGAQAPPHHRPTWLARKTRAVALRSAPFSSPLWPASSLARRSAASGAMLSSSAKTPPRSRCPSSNRSAARARCMYRSRSRTARRGTPRAATAKCSSISWVARSRGQAIDEYQYVNSEGDGIELKPGDYELTVDEPPVATDGTRYRASKRMVPVSFNSQAPDTVDSTPQGGFDLYAIAQ